MQGFQCGLPLDVVVSGDVSLNKVWRLEGIGESRAKRENETKCIIIESLA